MVYGDKWLAVLVTGMLFIMGFYYGINCEIG